MTTSDAIVVPGLYVGYPGVAFGGYVAGVLAERSGAAGRSAHPACRKRTHSAPETSRTEPALIT